MVARRVEGDGDGTAFLRERYAAAMVLSAVGDAVGFRCGLWEFETSGEKIHAELLRLTQGAGISALTVRAPGWIVSDDTVMHIATAEGLIEATDQESLAVTCKRVAARYVACWPEMDGRAPGGTCASAVRQLHDDGDGWDRIAFSATAGGCGASMRSACIGLRYPRAEQLAQLVAVAVETGRTTHHNPTGYLGAVVAALFTAYAIRGVPARHWGRMLLAEGIPEARRHIEAAGRDVESNLAAFAQFVTKWQAYLALRRIDGDDNGEPVFPEVWDVRARDAYNTTISFNGWGGSSGDDSVIIAYDSLLWAGASWEKLVMSAVLHGGDNDSTGAIACAWFGAIHGIRDVPLCNHQHVEFHDHLEELAAGLLDRANPVH
jgi:ADP-ribosylarginine hydrolase